MQAADYAEYPCDPSINGKCTRSLRLVATNPNAFALSHARKGVKLSSSQDVLLLTASVFSNFCARACDTLNVEPTRMQFE